MQVTRTKQIRGRKSADTFRVTMDVSDLPLQQQDISLRRFWSTLLWLAADQEIALAMYQSGAFHRDSEKNEQMAEFELGRIEGIRKEILGV